MHDPEYIAIPLWAQDGSIRCFALIDTDDEAFAEFRWSFNGTYAARRVQRRTVYLHRALMGLTPGDGLEVDHVNRDQLDNRRSNLRIVTHAQNHQNRGSHRGSTSRYRGVSWSAKRKMWRAETKIKGSTLALAYFHDELEAADAAKGFREALMTHSVDK